MSTAIVNQDGSFRQLDAKPQPDEVVKAVDVEDSTKLARLLTRLLTEIASLRRRYAPRRTTFRDIFIDNGSEGSPQSISLAHRFGARVEWWVVRVHDEVGVVLPLVVEDADASDENTLTLQFFYRGVFDVRVEEAG